jgi:hypothetical protein
MSGVFQIIDPPCPTPSPPGECVVYPPPFGGGGEGHTRWVERGWRSIYWKTPDTALYSTYLKVHKREKFFGSDFEFFTILLLIKLKY